MTAAAGNTNPLAGSPASAARTAARSHGSWGQSRSIWRAVGVKPGDTVKLRFDFGMDGCAGIDGWYVDDVKVRACNVKRGTATVLKD